MCNFGAWEKWRERIRIVSSYRDVDITKYQCRLFNTTPLEYITGYIMEDDVGDRALKSMSHRSLNFIDGYISSYCSIINLPERIEHIRKANKLTSVLCDLGSYCMREK